MGKIILSLVSIMALSGMAYGGGDIAPTIEPVVEIPEVKHGSLYAGVGVGQASVDNDALSEEISATTFTLQAGYQVNDYFAIEGRYTHSIGGSDYEIANAAGSDSYDGDLSAWGVYLKPMYPIGEFSFYALLGYGGVMLEDLAGGDAVENGFQWGLGLSYAISDKYSVYADYVSLYDDTGFDYRAQLNDVDAEAWTVGFSYRF
jgi:opacity protein-like surface antigen